MDYDALFDRILKRVDQQAYLAFADAVPTDQAAAMAQVEHTLRTADPSAARALAHNLHDEGRIDRVMLHSALHVIAASPVVADYSLAARHVADQESAAISIGGPELSRNLASVERHRGVLAFLQERYDVALDYFSRAFERQHSPGNLANVLSTLLRLKDIQEARELLCQVRTNFHPEFIGSLDQMIGQDPDLALLRTE